MKIEPKSLSVPSLSGFGLTAVRFYFERVYIKSVSILLKAFLFGKKFI